MIAVSYLKSILSKKETIEKIDNSLADYIHVDLMDGEYVPEKNFNIDEVIDDLKGTTKPLDIHLMVNSPEIYIDKLAKLKPLNITIHLNSSQNMLETINMIKEYNINAGIAINPNEDIKELDNYLDVIDYILIMSVYPGKGGQSFIKEVLNKIDYIKDKNKTIGIDGGVNEEVITILKDYPLDIIVSGSYVCMSDDYNKQILKLKESVD